MNRFLFLERIWFKSPVPVFLERFLLVVCATAFFGLVINNSMSLDLHQRIGLGFILVGGAYLIAHTVYKTNRPPALPIPPTIDAPPSTPINPNPDVPHEKEHKKSITPNANSHPKTAPLTGFSDGQRFVLKQKLGQYKGNSVRIVLVGSDPAANVIFEQLIDVFQDAAIGWQVETAQIGQVLVVGTNFPRVTYLTGSDMSSPVLAGVYSIFASVGINLPLTPNAYSGPASLGPAPIVIVVRSTE